MEKDAEESFTAPNSSRGSTRTINDQLEGNAATASPAVLSQVSSVPDGGLQAWLIVFGSTIAMLNTFGVINSFGTFQTYWGASDINSTSDETELLATHSPSDISWIGSLQAALLMMGAIASGPLFDMGYFHAEIMAGNFFVVFGMFMTSLCTEYWQVLLAQGLCVGIGCALLFTPSAAILSQYFARRRALALGFQSVGAPIGGIVLPIVFGHLQPRIGFPWATRIIAFILLALSAIPIAFMKTRVPHPKQKRPIIDREGLTDLPFLLFTAGAFLVFLGMYVPFFYVQLYSLDHAIAPSVGFSPYFVTFLNVGSAVGRLLPNYIAVRAGSLNILILTACMSSVLAFVWMGVHDFGGLVVFTLFYGMFSGGINSLAPSVVAVLTPELSRLGTRMGMSFFCVGIAVLAGTPIGGAILGRGSGAAWRAIIAYDGAVIMGGTVLFLVTFVLKQRQLGTRKI